MNFMGYRRANGTVGTRNHVLVLPTVICASAVAEMIDAIRLPIIAAGGIASLSHLKMLEKLGAEGAIVGKALYTGDIDLKKALRELN